MYTREEYPYVYTSLGSLHAHIESGQCARKELSLTQSIYDCIHIRVFAGSESVHAKE